ncbi:MAG: N-6 DNA methylase [Chloroflexi bacterium]|nr:N-6 DNA methylase [Chloroflexota bacterium]
MGDTEFGLRLKSYLSRLAEAKERKAHHDQLRQLFLDFLKDAFPDLHTQEIELERQVKALQVRGFIDLLYKDLIFEFKRDLQAERPKGLEELTRYLRAQPEPHRLFGILTDGQHFEIYTLRDGQLSQVETTFLDVAQPEEARLWLDCYLFAQRQVLPNTQDIIRRFGEKSPVFASAFGSLWRLLSQVRNQGSVDTKLKEWGRLLAYVYGSDVYDQRLFLHHTYLALFVRLLAFVALMRRPPSDQELSGIIDGRTFEGLGIQNLVEEDFFAWVLEPQISSETLSLLRGLAAHVRIYDFSRINEDLLKELYQEMLDYEARHGLGEYYTPDWLAELTLREAGFGSGKSLLDPGVGSGTFIFTAIRLLREEGVKGEVLVRWAQDNLGGIDVHPLAVIIARVNFLLALAPELAGGSIPGPLRLPIYMADTLRAPEVKIQPTIPIEVAVTDRPSGVPDRFDLPVVLAGESDKMERLLDALRDYARMPGNEGDLLEGLRATIAQERAQEWGWFFENNFRLLRHLVSIGRDTVYIFILRNAYRPELFSQRQFDIVAGNPPWLSYRYIQQPQYQERVKKLVFYHSLMESRQVRLFTQMKLATLFFAHCYDRFLKDDGAIAFVMPRSVLTGAKQHARFQKKFLPDKVLDLEGVAPLFNVPACVLIKVKGPAQAKATTTLVKGELPAKNMALAEARQRLAFSTAAPAALKTSQQSPYLSKFFQGATIVPRALWFVRPPQVLALDLRKPQLVEAEFLYATLLSTDLVPFGYRRLRLVVLPITVDSGGKTRLIGRGEALRRGKDGLARWLGEVEQLWREKGRGTDRVATPYDRLNYDSNLTRQRAQEGWKVLYPRAGTYLAACVVSLGKFEDSSLIPIKPKGFLSDTMTYDCAAKTPEEAHYICAILNAPMVDTSIKPFQTRGAFGERDIHRRPFEVLPIPIFDPQNRHHRRLAELSQECHGKVAAMSLPQNRGIGRLRHEVREILKAELAGIDALVRDILR